MRIVVDIVCRAYLLVLSTYHVFTGLASCFAPDLALSFYRKFYDCNPVERKHLALVLQPWGALALCAGIAGLFAASDPVRYRGVILALAILLALRVYYRLVYRSWLHDISGIAPRRNALSVGVLVAGLAILVSWLVLAPAGGSR